MFAVMKTFVTDISASTGRNDFIFDINKTRCCTLRRAKNTPTRSFVSFITANMKNSKSHGKQEVDVR
jgi:hypothetical protein